MTYMQNLKESEWPHNSGLTGIIINDLPGIKYYYSLGMNDIYQRHKETFRPQIKFITNTASTTISGNGEKKTLNNKNIEMWDVEKLTPVKQHTLSIVTGSISGTQTETPPRVPVSSLIAYVRDQLDVPFAGKLVKRLDYLEETSREEYLIQAPIFPQSLQDFICFFESVPNLAYPDIVLTPPGNIRAQWRKARNQHLAIEFLGNDDIRFVVFAPDKKNIFKVTRVSGQTSIDSLMDILHPYGVRCWVTLSEKKAA